MKKGSSGIHFALYLVMAILILIILKETILPLLFGAQGSGSGCPFIMSIMSDAFPGSASGVCNVQ